MPKHPDPDLVVIENAKAQDMGQSSASLLYRLVQEAERNVIASARQLAADIRRNDVAEEPNRDEEEQTLRRLEKDLAVLDFLSVDRSSQVGEGGPQEKK